jgi:hypothetical protein
MAFRYDIESGECILTVDAHDARIRNIAVVPTAAGEGDLMITSSTDGAIRVWRMPGTEHAGPTEEVVARKECLKEIATKDRLTCMTVLHAGTAGVAPLAKKSDGGLAKAAKKKKKKERQLANKRAKAGLPPVPDGASGDASATGDQKGKGKGKGKGAKRGAQGEGGAAGDEDVSERGAAAAASNPTKKRKRGKKGAETAISPAADAEGEDTTPDDTATAGTKKSGLKPKPKSKLKRKNKKQNVAVFETVPVQAQPVGEPAPFDESDGNSTDGDGIDVDYDAAYVQGGLAAEEASGSGPEDDGDSSD